MGHKLWWVPCVETCVETLSLTWMLLWAKVRRTAFTHSQYRYHSHLLLHVYHVIRTCRCQVSVWCCSLLLQVPDLKAAGTHTSCNVSCSAFYYKCNLWSPSIFRLKAYHVKAPHQGLFSSPASWHLSWGSLVVPTQLAQGKVMLCGKQTDPRKQL